MQSFLHFLKLFLYFLVGATTTAFILVSVSYLIFSASYRNKTYPGVKVNNLGVGSQTKDQVKNSLNQVGSLSTITSLQISLTHPQASVSAKASEINLRPDIDLMVDRAFSIGRQTKNPYHNFLQILSAWQGYINLPIEIALDRETVNKKIDIVAGKIEKPAVDAVFKFDPTAGPDRKGRVNVFTHSENGLIIDREKVYQEIISQTKKLPTNSQIPSASAVQIPIYTRILVPNIQTSTADQMGIKSLLGRGESYFYDSIPGRVYNIKLGTDKISGSLIAPNEIFSFDHAIGTVSAVFGFQKAYAIKEGKTVLDDGGGVCQVSTTLYRAVLNAGLPVIERVAHTYRVGFYEQGGFLPGLDATVYPPSPDLKFKNDTPGYILIQTIFDPERAKLTFELFGTDDGRKTQIQGPYILSTSPPPDPIYEDDSTLPVGQQKQVDTAHYGAEVYFKRIVTRGSETPINETVKSSFVPWPARFLRGTKNS